MDVLNPDLRDLVIGLVSAAVAALLAWFYRSISRRRADRLAVLRHPIGGRYASKYTDEIGGVRRVVRDEVRIDQHGAKFTEYRGIWSRDGHSSSTAASSMNGI